MHKPTPKTISQGAHAITGTGARAARRLALPLAALGLSAIAFADSGKPAPPPKKPPAPAIDTPLTALPYTPSLDVPSMDTTVDPCVDFYAYSCGGWRKANPIPPDQAAWSVYAKLQHDNERFLWGLLLEAAKAARGDAKGRTAADQKIGDYFSSCMDEEAVEKSGLAPIKPALDEIAKLKAPGDLAAFLGKQHLTLGQPGMAFGVWADQDFDDSEKIIAFLVAGGLGLPDRDYYFKEDKKSVEIRGRYVAHVARMLELLGEKPDDAKLHSVAIMKLETALAGASLTRVEKRDPHNLHHNMTQGELQALTPTLSWAGYFGALGAPGLTKINVTEPAFFKQLEKELKATPMNIWREYLRWQLVNGNAEYLTHTLAEADFDFFRRYLRGVDQNKPRWRRCVSWVDRDLGEALGEVFVRKTFGPEVKQRTVAMTAEIEKAMREDLEKLPWMSAETKKEALAKLHAMVNKIGFPDKWRDYSKLEIKPGDFAGNVLRGIVFESRRILGKIGKPIDRGEWQMTPPTVNAYYSAQMNDMNFPAGVLQPPLFDAKMDDAPNYGNTGSTIGHELTHGFDDEGRQFDARGNLRDWWTPADAKQFSERAACVVDQYAHYPVVDDIKINSKLTLGEDVADLGGTRLAYLAWQHVTANQRLAPIGGLTPNQRFFIGMAQWACSNERDENKRLSAITNPHSPPEWRVNGVVANMPEFAAAFVCKPGKPMVRAKPCQVW